MEVKVLKAEKAEELQKLIMNEVNKEKINYGRLQDVKVNAVYTAMDYVEVPEDAVGYVIYPQLFHYAWLSIY